MFYLSSFINMESWVYGFDRTNQRLAFFWGNWLGILSRVILLKQMDLNLRYGLHYTTLHRYPVLVLKVVVLFLYRIRAVSPVWTREVTVVPTAFNQTKPGQCAWILTILNCSFYNFLWMVLWFIWQEKMTKYIVLTLLWIQSWLKAGLYAKGPCVSKWHRMFSCHAVSGDNFRTFVDLK